MLEHGNLCANQFFYNNYYLVGFQKTAKPETLFAQLLTKTTRGSSYRNYLSCINKYNFIILHNGRKTFGFITIPLQIRFFIETVIISLVMHFMHISNSAMYYFHDSFSFYLSYFPAMIIIT